MTTNDSLDALRKQAKEALARGQYPEARKIYAQALVYYSQSPEVHYGMGTVCFLLEDLDSAAQHFQEMIRLQPNQALAYINLGAVYNRLGNYDESVKTLRRGIQLDPNRAEGYYNLALAYKHFGELDLALNAYREALRLNSRMYEAHLNMGNIYREKGNLLQARVRYQQALELRPTCDKARESLQAIEAELAAQQQSVVPVAPAPAKPTRQLNLDQPIDPHRHGEELRDLHHVVIELDNSGQSMLNVLKNHVETAIRDLSICILTPKDPRHKLEERLKQFDDAVIKLQQSQESLQQRLLRARGYYDKILDS